MHYSKKIEKSCENIGARAYAFLNDLKSLPHQRELPLHYDKVVDAVHALLNQYESVEQHLDKLLMTMEEFEELQTAGVAQQ